MKKTLELTFYYNTDFPELGLLNNERISELENKIVLFEFPAEFTKSLNDYVREPSNINMEKLNEMVYSRTNLKIREGALHAIKALGGRACRVKLIDKLLLFNKREEHMFAEISSYVNKWFKYFSHLQFPVIMSPLHFNSLLRSNDADKEYSLNYCFRKNQNLTLINEEEFEDSTFILYYGSQ